MFLVTSTIDFQVKMQTQRQRDRFQLSDCDLGLHGKTFGSARLRTGVDCIRLGPHVEGLDCIGSRIMDLCPNLLCKFHFNYGLYPFERILCETKRQNSVEYVSSQKS